MLEKSNKCKIDNTSQEDKPEGSRERRKTKKISWQGKTTQTKQEIRKQQNKMLPANKGECAKIYQ